MVTVVDHSEIKNQYPVGDGSWSEFRGQTFVAADAVLRSLEFYADHSYGPAMNYRVLVTEALINGTDFNPGAVLFEKVLAISPDGDDLSQAVTVDTGKLALTPGKTYAFIIEAFSDADAADSALTLGLSNLGAVGDVEYPDGTMVELNAIVGTRQHNFDAAWQESPSNNPRDLAFKLVFDGATTIITGTNKNDRIDATHAPIGQPKPGGNPDLIFGLKGDDRLFGLGGDDQLSGGKGKDQLTGGDGEDSFLFDVGVKQPADKIFDFNPVDDTILLASAKFKALTPGVLSEAAFRDIGEASSPEACIIYKPNGKLLYDKTGGKADDAIAFAKLVGAPDITAADMLVV